MSPLDRLEAAIASLDPKREMAGISYERTSNNTLGFGHAPTPTTYHVSIPYSSWPTGPSKAWTAPATSILQAAFKDVIKGGFSTIFKDDKSHIPPDISGNFIIDIAHLGGVAHDFFIEKPTDGPYKGRSVADEIAAAVNSLAPYPHIKPVVRFLMGIWGDEKTKIGARAWDDGTAQEFNKMFW